MNKTEKPQKETPRARRDRKRREEAGYWECVYGAPATPAMAKLIPEFEAIAESWGLGYLNDPY